MQKKTLIKNFINVLSAEMKVLKEAALATRDAAISEEAKPENQYDTRAIEASYLAGAQAKRVNEIEEVIQLFQTSQFIEFKPSDAIDNTALVTLKIDGKRKVVLMMPKGGGVACDVDNTNVQIVTPSSALGEAILGLKRGDYAEFEIGEAVRECEVLGVY